MVFSLIFSGGIFSRILLSRFMLTAVDEHGDFDVLRRSVHQLRDRQILALVQVDNDPGHVRGHGQAEYRQVQLQWRERDAPLRVPHDYALVVGPGQRHRPVAAELDARHVSQVTGQQVSVVARVYVPYYEVRVPRPGHDDRLVADGHGHTGHLVLVSDQHLHACQWHWTDKSIEFNKIFK